MSKMFKVDPNYSQDCVEGREDYVDHVCVFVQAEAVCPGYTKICEISIKPVTVHCFNLIYYPFIL